MIDKKKFSSLMCCFFNIGLDAEIQNQIETIKTENRFLNLALFTYVGLTKGLGCWKSKSVCNYIDNITKPETEDENTVVVSMDPENCHWMARNIVVQNVPSGCGGRWKDAWPNYRER